MVPQQLCWRPAGLSQVDLLYFLLSIFLGQALVAIFLSWSAMPLISV